VRVGFPLVVALALGSAVPVLAVPAPAANTPPVQADPAEGARPAYNPTGRRDPFRPFTIDIHPEARVQLTPLQRYELGQLTVVGTVWEVSPPRAMVEDSVGMGYIVTLGTPIGRNGGLVTAIEPRRVIVEERVLDYYGKEQVNRIVMETPKEEESPSQLARERK
jgi:Tfp pilus assembly protein PilP